MKSTHFICLGIETSCDETAVSVVENGWKILSNIVLSQEELHKVYGGIVPEIACRAHIESITPILEQALKKAEVKLSNLKAIAVTHRPGLVGALLVGVSAAKSLSLVLNRPLIAIDHLEAHLYAYRLGHAPSRLAHLKYPQVGLVASGGHTSLYLIKSPITYKKIGATIDDAAGEAFDKVSAILGLGYPGGPAIERMAREGNPDSIKFSPAYADTDSLNFSFSGLKTAVLYYSKGQNASRRSPLKRGLNIPDIAASFQETVVDSLVGKMFQAVEKFSPHALVLGGGVASNQMLRSRVQKRAKKERIKVFIPDRILCTDNAAMVAGLAYFKWQNKKVSHLYLDAMPS